jgi:SAM-dependent methyltransferase
MNSVLPDAPSCLACSAGMIPLYRSAFGSCSWMYRCPACALCRVLPPPAHARRIYEEAYTASADAARKNRRLAPDYFRKLLPFIPGKTCAVLEVGGSHGWLSELLRDRTGVRVTLLEPGHSAVESAKQRGLDAHCGFVEDFEPGHPFDLVCAMHVVEHVDDVDAFLAACARVLRPGGTLFLLTPNADAWKLEHFKQRWAWAVPDSHTLLLSAKSMQRLCARHDLEVKISRGVRPAFAHYPFFVARWFAERRALLPAMLGRLLGFVTRPLALVEFVLLNILDIAFGESRADELLVVAHRKNGR